MAAVLHAQRWFLGRDEPAKILCMGCPFEWNILVTRFEELTHWKRPWGWERLKAGGEGDNRRWDCWMASLTRWTWVWINSRSWWWWTGRPGMLQSMGSQRVRQDSNWTELNWARRNTRHPKVWCSALPLINRTCPNSSSLGQKIPWRRKWQPTPVFLPGKTHWHSKLSDYSPWNHKGLNMPEHTCPTGNTGLVR